MKERTIVILLVAVLTPLMLFGVHRFLKNTEEVARTFEQTSRVEIEGRKRIKEAARQRNKLAAEEERRQEKIVERSKESEVAATLIRLREESAEEASVEPPAGDDDPQDQDNEELESQRAEDEEEGDIEARELTEQERREREREEQRDRERQAREDQKDPVDEQDEEPEPDPNRQRETEAEKRLASMNVRRPDVHALTVALETAEDCDLLATYRKVEVRFPAQSESIRGASLFELDAMINEARRCTPVVFALSLAEDGKARSSDSDTENTTPSGFDELTGLRLDEVKYHLQQRGIDPTLVLFPEVP